MTRGSLLYALVFGVVAGAFVVLATRATGEWTTVDVGPVASRMVAEARVVATGGVRTITSAEGGRVAKVRVEEGAAVAEGDVLAELDGPKRPDGAAGDPILAKSPIAGVVLSKRIGPGDVAPPHATLFEIADAADTQLRVEIDEPFADRVRLGQLVTLRRPGDKDGGAAVIERLGARLEPRTVASDDASRGRGDGLVRPAWAKWKSSAPAWALIGQRLDATIQLGEPKPVTRVARCAVGFRHDKPVVDARLGLWTREIAVEVGTADEVWVAVTGVEAGTSVLCR